MGSAMREVGRGGIGEGSPLPCAGSVCGSRRGSLFGDRRRGRDGGEAEVPAARSVRISGARHKARDHDTPRSANAPLEEDLFVLRFGFQNAPLADVQVKLRQPLERGPHL